ncbi:DUF4340 domain-containing protein [Desulfoluna sp.]|uniref:DUF4340 domain-containing protein n=1 Tax=Desulfoluna sp. TaxID=2045199 RepID=UPI00260E58E0|nr:DUF4340 domain-containing protein [Desulfoluna sp.]
MKKETLILLAMILALSAYLFLRNTDGTGYDLPVLRNVATGEVDRMEIKTESDTLLFEKEGEGWIVDIEGFPGKKEEVLKRVQTAAEISLTALVSESESYRRYDLSPDKAKTVQLFQGETLLRTVIMGKAAPSLGHTFVTLSGDKNIYHAKGNFTSQFTTDPEPFIDKSVFSFSPTDVTSLAIKQGDAVKTLTRTPAAAKDDGISSAVWKDADGNTLESDQVDTVITAISHLVCATWLVNKPEETAPVLSLTLTTDRPHTLNLFGNAGGRGTATDKKFEFSLSESKGADIMHAVTSLMEMKVPEQQQTSAN